MQLTILLQSTSIFKKRDLDFGVCLETGITIMQHTVFLIRVKKFKHLVNYMGNL